MDGEGNDYVFFVVLKVFFVLVVIDVLLGGKVGLICCIYSLLDVWGVGVGVVYGVLYGIWCMVFGIRFGLF